MLLSGVVQQEIWTSCLGLQDATGRPTYLPEQLLICMDALVTKLSEYV